MKRIILSLLCVVLLVAAISSVSAEEMDTRNAEVFSMEQIKELYGNTKTNIRQIVEGEGVVYAYLTNSSICCWKPGSDTIAHVCQLPQFPKGVSDSYREMSKDDQNEWKEIVTHIYTSGSNLYGINSLNGKTGLIDESGVHWQGTLLDLQFLFPEKAAWPVRIVKIFTNNDNLYIFIAMDDDEYPHNHYQLLCFNKETGKCDLININDAQGLCCAEESKVFLLCYEDDHWVIDLMDLNNYEITRTQFDAGSVSYDQPIGGLAYNATNHSFYYVSEGIVFITEEGSKAKPFATMPVSDAVGESCAFILSDEAYAYSDNTLIVRYQQEGKLDKTLRLAGCMDDRILQSFTKENPDIPISFDEELLSPDEIVTQLLTGDSNFDLYHTCVDSTFAALVRKGYAMDLSTSQILTDDVKRMYPNIRKVITNAAGNPVAYPYTLMLDNWNVNITWWRAVFGEEPLPETYAEFFRTMIRWEEEYAEQYPEFSFAGDFDYSYWVKTVMNAFEAQYASFSGETLVPADLGNPLLAEVLDLIDRVREIREEYHRSTDGDDMVYTEPIINSDGFNAIMNYSWPEELLPLSIEELPDGIWTDMPAISFEKGKTAPVDGQLYVWFVNPHSENKDLAIRYLEHAARCENNIRTYYGTHPDMTEPVPDEGTAARCEELEEQLEQLRAKAGEQEEINPELEQRIRESEAELLLWENQKWEISEEAIREYRGFAETIAFHEDNPYVMRVGRSSNTATEMEALFEQYRYGQVSRDEFLWQYQSRMDMILAERR